MRRILAGAVALATAVVLAGVPAKPAAAQPTTFSTGFQVQNLSSTAANISIQLYQLDTTGQPTSVDAVIPANDKVTYAQLSELPGGGPAAGFSGSAVISSDQRVAAIVNVVAPDSSISFGGESYVGATTGANSVNLPLLAKAAFNFNSFFNVQNVGQTATNITVTYSGGGLSAPVTETYNTLQPGVAHRFDQAANAQLPAGFNGSAIVTSSASPVAAVVTQVGPSTMLIYNGISTGIARPVFPLVNVQPNNGLETGISVQNVGDRETRVTISYSPSGTEGTACTETQTIPARGTRFFAIDSFNATRTPPAGTETNCAKGSLFVGSARVTANVPTDGSGTEQPLVAIVNQLNQRATSPRGASYSGFDTSAATTTSNVVFPLLQDRVFGYFTGISILNVGDVATPIQCTFTGTNVTQASQGNIEPGRSFTTQQLNVIGDRYNGAGTCRATANGARIVGIANLVRVSGTADSFFVYEGVNN